MVTEDLSFLVEHLPRIGTTSVDIHASSQPVIVSQRPDRLCVQVVDGRSASINLPCKTSIEEQSRFTAVSPGYYRLRIKSQSEVANAQNVFMALPEGKWSKKELLAYKSFEVHCLKCKNCILNYQDCCKINDMPSEFWMELMDYWHCHKPHDTTKREEYSARYNSLKPLKGEVLVGSAFFLAQKDTFVGTVHSERNQLQCIKCNALLGEETKDRLFKLNKWQLSLKIPTGKNDIFPPEQDIVITLLNLIKGYSTRYVLLESEDLKLFVWLFAIGIDVTLPDNQVLTNCIKVLYRDEFSEQDLKGKNLELAKVKSVPMQHFVRKLEETHQSLHPDVRQFNSWRISYFEVTA